MQPDEPTQRHPVILGPGEGRSYDMGRIQAVFKADGTETSDGYSISEWWLEPHTTGPGAHRHPEDDVFYVLDGTMTLLVDQEWVEAPRGSFVLVPGGTLHDFQNRSDRRAGVLNFSYPGGFEPHMGGIVDWFRQHPPGDPAAVGGQPPR
jgi:quercetin dioxygenase-like cupin family protein